MPHFWPFMCLNFRLPCPSTSRVWSRDQKGFHYSLRSASSCEWRAVWKTGILVGISSVPGDARQSFSRQLIFAELKWPCFQFGGGKIVAKFSKPPNVRKNQGSAADGLVRQFDMYCSAVFFVFVCDPAPPETPFSC